MAPHTSELRMPAGGNRQNEQLLALGYDTHTAQSLLHRAGGCVESPADVERAISSLEYGRWPAHEFPEHALIDAVRAGICTCFEAALIAHDLMSLLSLNCRLMALHRMDPATNSHLGHAAVVYEALEGSFGAIALSRYPTQRHRPPRYRSIDELAVSYAEAYLALGLVPVCFGTAALDEIGNGLDWRREAADLKVLHFRLLETQVNIFDLSR